VSTRGVAPNRGHLPSLSWLRCRMQREKELEEAERRSQGQSTLLSPGSALPVWSPGSGKGSTPHSSTSNSGGPVTLHMWRLEWEQGEPGRRVRGGF